MSWLPSGLVHAQSAAGSRSAQIDNADFQVQMQDGWLTRWVNKRTGEAIDFGKPANAAELSSVYQPGAWFIPGYKQETKPADWSVKLSSPQSQTLVIQQDLDVSGGDAHAVQWSMRLPLDQIDASYWPTFLTPQLIAKDSEKPDGAIGRNYYFDNRLAILSSHQWRMRFYVIQGNAGGLLIYVNDPNLDHFNAIELEKSNFPKEVVITNRSIASPPWSQHYSGSKWVIVQYAGGINNAAQIMRDYLTQAYDLKPLAKRPTAWIENLGYTFVRAPFTSPVMGFSGSPDKKDYTKNWEKNLKLVDQWLDNAAKVLDPDKTMFYVNWWRYYGHDTMFPEYSVDPFFELAVNKARQRGFHVMLHFHNHLVQDASPFFGRYVQTQDQWDLASNPKRPRAVGDTEGKLPWGVGYDFLRRMPVIQSNKEFGTVNMLKQLGLPSRMTGYHMSPAYEGWRYMKVAEILGAIRATGADAIHLDVPAVWPEGAERYGMNSQQGLREFYKLLRRTLDENGLSHVAIATEDKPGEGYMGYVDAAQLVRGLSTVSRLNGIMVDTMIELQLGDDLDKANELRKELTARYPTTAAAEAKKKLKFDPEVTAKRFAGMREIGAPSLDTLVIAPYVRAYPHLGAASPLMGANKGDPNAAVANRVAQALHTWATIQRAAIFSSEGNFQMFMDAAPWDSMAEIRSKQKENIKAGIRSEGKIFNDYSYGEFALERFWQKNQPRLAPLNQWQPQDMIRFVLADGSTMTVQRRTPLCLNLSVNGKTLADIDLFDGWKNSDALLKDYGPAWLLNQIDGHK